MSSSVSTSNSSIILDDQIKPVKRTVFNSHVQTNIIPNYHSISDVRFPQNRSTKSENETDSENSESGDIVGFRHGYGHHWLYGPYRHYGHHWPYGHYGHYWHRYGTYPYMFPYGMYPYSSLF